MSRIVLGEDHPDLAFLVEIVLDAAGHQVETHATGEGVLAACRTSPDLLLLDVHLRSGPDGVEVTRRLREAEQAAADAGAPVAPLPVLLLSAGAPAALREAGRRAGASDWLVKPFEIPELQARVDLLLASRP